MLAFAKGLWTGANYSVKIQPDSTEIAIFNRAYINSLRVVRYIAKLSYKVELQLTMPSTIHSTNLQPPFNQLSTQPPTPPRRLKAPAGLIRRASNPGRGLPSELGPVLSYSLLESQEPTKR